MSEFSITSPDFEEGGEIPKECGYNNGNVSPHLKILVPATAKSVALIMDDPDAMNVEIDGKKPYKVPYVHWVLYNIYTLDQYQRHEFDTEPIVIIPKGKTDKKPLKLHQWDQAKSNKEIINRNKDFLTAHNHDRFGSSEIRGHGMPDQAGYGLHGVNDFGEFDYGGPAPPDKKHTYIFKAYALDVDKLPDLPRTDKPGTKDEVEDAMKGHIIGEAKLTGTFAP